MKKFLLHCFIFLAGVIAAVGWVIACAAISGRSSVISCIYGVDYVFIFAFLAVAAYGLWGAIKETKEERKQ